MSVITSVIIIVAVMRFVVAITAVAVGVTAQLCEVFLVPIILDR